MSLHDVRFPGESAEYRSARDELLEAEVALRRQTEAVAEMRRRLPLGGRVRDYLFDQADLTDPTDTGAGRAVSLSQLFQPGRDTLVVYGFMFGPRMARPCPSCTSMLDALDGAVPHVTQRVNLAVIARSPLPRVRAFARERGWRHLTLLSSADNAFNADYHAEDEQGAQLPALNVFVRREGGTIFHTYGSELLFVPAEPGQDPRHVDPLWPLWNLLDFTPEGRGAEWYPRLRYDVPRDPT
jgi:predicted dithiol-disulfide oxidoreductase (DUF899 family)